MMIELKDLTIGFQDRILLKNASTIFPSNKLTALIGRNGTGKSTLLKTIAGIRENYKGEILIQGQNIKNIPKNILARKLAYVSSRRPEIPNFKCVDVVNMGRSPYTEWHGKITENDKRIVSEALEKVGMSSYYNRYFNSLSDGESQKIMMARALAQETPIIVLDEPTSFLDLTARYELVNLLKNLTEQDNKTILFSTHELNIALKLADNICLIDDSKLKNSTSNLMKQYLLSAESPFSFLSGFSSSFD